MRLILLTVVSVFLVVTTGHSQIRTITGRVLDSETRKPIKNATIILLGTTSGTFSNHLGFFQFTIDTTKHKTLIVSHIGCKTSGVRIPDAENFKVFLTKDFIELNAVNLFAYPQELAFVTLHRDSIRTNPDGFGVAESDARYPSGIDNFYKVVGNTLANERHRVSEMGVHIKFTINEAGRPTNIFISDSMQLSQTIAENAFHQMPSWIPATQNQQNVAQYFSMRILNFKPIVHMSPELGDFYGNLKGFYEFMLKNVRYPAEARRMDIQGAVYVEFQVSTHGQVSDIKVVKDIGSGCGNEIKRVISIMPKSVIKSLPAETKLNTFVLPVFFEIEGPSMVIPTLAKIDSIPGTFLLRAFAVKAVGIMRERLILQPSGGVTSNRPVNFGRTPVPVFYDLDKALKAKQAPKRLSLTNSKLNTIPANLLTLTRLQFLDLERNDLQTLPREIERLTQLQELYLFDNKIEKLPENFGNLKKMKVLGLGSNQLTSLPVSITILEKLETLDLSDNELASLPSSIGNMKNLKTLLLRNNKITHIPPEFYQLQKLEKLDLQGNPIDPKDIALLREAIKKADIEF